MQPIPESFSIVIPGGWNPRIFSHEWIAKNLCLKEDSAEIQTSLPVGPMSLSSPIRIEFDGLFLYPSSDHIKITPKDATLEGIKNAYSLCDKILTLLPHTPIVGLGVNFAFNIEAPEETVTVSDSNELETVYNVIGTEVSRSLQYNENVLLNFKISLNKNNSILNFNFHHDIQSIESLSSTLNGNQIDEYYTAALNLIGTIYEQQ